MASLRWLDEDDRNSKRAKIEYDVRDVSGVRRRKSKTFPPHTSMKTIREFMRKVEQEYDDSEGVDYSKRTLDQFMKEYFSNYVKGLSPSTLINYRRLAYAKKHGISDNLGRIDLAKLRTSHVQEYVDHLDEEGLSPKTIRNHVGLIHTMYDRATKLRYVQRGYNVVSEVELPKLRKKKAQSYSAEEVKVLLSLADKYAKEELRFLIYLAILTGARRSEMAALRICDVDLPNKIWHITACKIYAGKSDVVKEPKTDAGIRDVPLCDTICHEIRKMIRRYEKNKKAFGKGFQDTQFIFSDASGKPYRTNTLTKWYVKFMQDHTDEIRYLPLHCAGRHTYASLAIMQGIDVKALQEILGHSDAGVTLNTYSNSFMSAKQAYASSLEETLFTDED